MRCKFLIALISVVLLPKNVYAVAVPFLGWGYSVGYGIGWVAGSQAHREGHAWSTVFDPPTDILRGKATFAYDPDLIIIHPEFSAFIGDFSDNPATAIPFNSTGVYGNMHIGFVPGPRPGMMWSLDVGPNTVTLEFDLSANPVTLASEAEHVNFFALALETTIPLAGWIVEPTSTGHFRELGSPADQSQTFMICRDSRGEYSCGDITSLGLTAAAIPEPSTVALVGAALLGICGFRKWGIERQG